MTYTMGGQPFDPSQGFPPTLGPSQPNSPNQGMLDQLSGGQPPQPQRNPFSGMPPPPSFAGAQNPMFRPTGGLRNTSQVVSPAGQGINSETMSRDEIKQMLRELVMEVKAEHRLTNARSQGMDDVTAQNTAIFGNPQGLGLAIGPGNSGPPSEGNTRINVNRGSYSPSAAGGSTSGVAQLARQKGIAARAQASVKALRKRRSRGQDEAEALSRETDLGIANERP